MTQAEDVAANPSTGPQELQDFLSVAEEQSTASESTVRKDFTFADGSILAAMSSQGGAVFYETFEPTAPVE